jgi:hypothetical protein
MGTQQVWKMILVVLLVGTMIFLGFKMFDRASYNNGKQATAAEMQNYVRQLVGWWTTSADLGGAACLNSNVTVAKVAAYLAFTGTNNSYVSANAEFRVVSIAASSPGVNLTLRALGKISKNGNKFPLVTTVVYFNPASTAAPTITTTVSDATTFP